MTLRSQFRVAPSLVTNTSLNAISIYSNPLCLEGASPSRSINLLIMTHLKKIFYSLSCSQALTCHAHHNPCMKHITLNLKKFMTDMQPQKTVTITIYKLRNTLSHSWLIKLYHTHFSPYMLYCSVVWGVYLKLLEPRSRLCNNVHLKQFSGS